jgi:YNFM family putative membrane transporter
MVGIFGAGLATLALLYAPQPLLPALAYSYSLHPANATLAVSVATAGLLLGVIPVAVLSHRYERRTVIVVSLLAATFFGGLTVIAPSWPVLLVLRGLQGVALAGVPATATAYAAEIYGITRAGLMSGLFVAGSTVGGLSGRFLAGILADVGGWRAGLGGVTVVAAIATLGTRFLLPRVVRPEPRIRNYVRPSHFASRTRSTWTRTLSALWHEADPLQIRLCLIALLLMTAFSATYNVLSFRLTAAPYSLSQGALGLVFLVYLAGTAASTISGRLSDQLPRKYLLVMAALLLAAGAGLTLSSPLVLIIVGLALLTGGFFAAHGVASGWTSVAARGQRSTAAARYTVWYYAGTTLGGPVGGTAYGHGQWTTTAIIVVILALLAAMVGLALPRSARVDFTGDTVRGDRIRSWLLLEPVLRPLVKPLRPLVAVSTHASRTIPIAGTEFLHDDEITDAEARPGQFRHRRQTFPENAAPENGRFHFLDQQFTSLRLTLDLSNALPICPVEPGSPDAWLRRSPRRDLITNHWQRPTATEGRRFHPVREYVPVVPDPR